MAVVKDQSTKKGTAMYDINGYSPTKVLALFGDPVSLSLRLRYAHEALVFVDKHIDTDNPILNWYCAALMIRLTAMFNQKI